MCALYSTLNAIVMSYDTKTAIMDLQAFDVSLVNNR